MSTAALPWLLVAALLAVAGGLAFRVRASTSRRAHLEGECARLTEQLAAAEKRFEERARSQRKRGEEVAELRKKLEKARKRAAQARDQQRGETSGLRDLQTALDRSEAERKRAQRELDRLRDELETRPIPTAKPAPVQAAPPSPPSGLSAELTSLRERADKADTRALELERAQAKLRDEVQRYKRKARALDDAYRAQRGELEVKKDRLRTQQEELERLRALKVTLIDSPPSDP